MLRNRTRIGVYEVSGVLAAGCMGAVYRARDKKSDPDRLARLVGVSQKLLGWHVAGPLELA
jgi:hypothetical protein